MKIDARMIAENAIGLFEEALEREHVSMIGPGFAERLAAPEVKEPVVDRITRAKAAAVAEVVAGVEADVESRTIRVCIYGEADAVLADRIFENVDEVAHAERIGLFSTRLREVGAS